ncbi:hypothetical protein NC651_023500 [Populus alba x Populus x berolinensis]|nr:hypothetical protein NC651_023500 [Populus alba x Populus x berolinensis]
MCKDNQCVACPLPYGLIGWSRDYQPVRSSSCGSKKLYYYKLEEVDHYMSKHTSRTGPINEDDCRRKCSGDCKCLGYFYWWEKPLVVALKHSEGIKHKVLFQEQEAYNNIKALIHTLSLYI